MEQNLKPIIEEFAELQHQIWSHWMKWMFKNGGQFHMGLWKMNPLKEQRWKRQMLTPYEELPEGEKDGDRATIREFLLPLVSELEMRRRQTKRLLHKRLPQGEANNKAKLTEKDVREIRALPGEMSHREIGKLYGVRHSTISDVRNRRTWKYIGEEADDREEDTEGDT